MSRHAALDPRDPSVGVQIPRPGTPGVPPEQSAAFEQAHAFEQTPVLPRQGSRRARRQAEAGHRRHAVRDLPPPPSTWPTSGAGGAGDATPVQPPVAGYPMVDHAIDQAVMDQAVMDQAVMDQAVMDQAAPGYPVMDEPVVHHPPADEEVPPDPAVTGHPRAPLRDPLPTVRAAARHHSGTTRGLVRGRRTPQAKAARVAAAASQRTGPRGIRLGRALLALLVAAVASVAAGSWMFRLWAGPTTPVVKAPTPAGSVRLDAVADTGRLSFSPGRTVQVAVQVENGNPGTVNVTRVQPKPVVLSEPIPPGCAPSMITVAPPTIENLAIPPGGGVFTASLTMAADAGPDCTGMAFAVGFTVEGRFAQP